MIFGIEGFSLHVDPILSKASYKTGGESLQAQERPRQSRKTSVIIVLTARNLYRLYSPNVSHYFINHYF
jgi:hypothetical protein